MAHIQEEKQSVEAVPKEFRHQTYLDKDVKSAVIKVERAEGKYVGMFFGLCTSVYVDFVTTVCEGTLKK